MRPFRPPNTLLVCVIALSAAAVPLVAAPERRRRRAAQVPMPVRRGIGEEDLLDHAVPSQPAAGQPRRQAPSRSPPAGSRAKKHSRSMARRDFFSHYGKRGSSPADRVRRTGYLSGSRRWRVAENIGWGKRLALHPTRHGPGMDEESLAPGELPARGVPRRRRGRGARRTGQGLQRGSHLHDRLRAPLGPLTRWGEGSGHFSAAEPEVASSARRRGAEGSLPGPVRPSRESRRPRRSQARRTQ
jgi:hypothetical protein